MTARRPPRPTDEHDEQVLRDVRDPGWHVVQVGSEDESPPWAFTIGLFHNFGHPELVLFGLPHDTAHVLLNLAGHAVKAGRRFETDTPYGDFLEGYDCILRAADRGWYSAFVGYAGWFYQGESFPLLQLFWPDRDGVMPWEPRATAWQRANQPLLYKSS